MDDQFNSWRRWEILASVFLVSFVVLTFEISLTRVFSVLFRYHYAFLAVSGAVCGLGLGGFAWHLISKTNNRRLEAGWAGLGFALLVPASIIILFGTPLSALLATHLWAAFIPLLPFGFAGVFLSEVFRQRAAESGRIYQADLIGAALAAVLIVPLMSITGPLYLAFLLGGMGALGALCWAAARGNRLLLRASFAGAVLCFALWPITANYDLLRLRPVSVGAPEITKPMLKDLADPGLHAQIIDSKWSAYARTDMVSYGLPQEGSSRVHIFTDGEVPAPMIHYDGNLKSVLYLKGVLTYFSFALYPRNSMLSIGPGGGLDFLLGSLAGFKQMDGVEINASMVNMVDRHRKTNGDIYRLPGVNVTVDDGRSFVRRSLNQYDLIVSALTQTSTTGNVGVALVESYIHTKEAFEDYYQHLTPNGRYTLVTQSEDLLLRAAFTAIEVLREHGINSSEATRHLIALKTRDAETVSNPYRYLLVWKKSPFNSEDIAMARHAVASGFADDVFIPGIVGNPVLAKVANGEVQPDQIYIEGMLKNGRLINLRPATDEKPFFLYLAFGVPGVLQGLLIGALGASLLYTIVMLWRRGRTGSHVRGWLVYFSAIGIGFMLVEIPLAQKFILFLGHPTLSLAVILFSLLIGASIGSRLSQNWKPGTLPRRVGLVGLIVALLVIIYALLLSPVLNLFLPLQLVARLLISALLLLPLGVALGIPFPSGLRLISASDQDEIPWMWGLNGIMSVAGGALAVAGAYLIGFSGCLLFAALIYASLIFYVPRTA